MLSNTSRQEILRKIQGAVGFAVVEENLTPATRQAITNLATVQRHLFAITEILRGENSRVERSVILRAAARLGKDSEKEERAALSAEISKLQADVESKVTDLSKQVLSEENARISGTSPPEYKGKLELEELKCPQCSANLPIPTGQFLKCQYCGSTFTIQDVSSQLSSMIQNI